MSDNDHERYFPNHKIEPEIGLAEYQFACEQVNRANEAVTWATNTTALIATGAFYATLEAANFSDGAVTSELPEGSFKLAILISVLIFSFFAVIHLAYLQKARIFASRKVIILRRMMGVSYGENTLVLPNWRLEGADDPFAIRLFPGLISYHSFPILIVLLVMFMSVLFLGDGAMRQLGADLGYIEWVGAFFVVCGLLVYRWHLRELDENTRLWVSIAVSRVIRVKLVDNFSHQIYRLKLDISEAKRIKADFKEVKRLAVFVEDKEFFTHRGINWAGVARALWSKIRGGYSGGGSSITQQFVRSNFIVASQSVWRRKIVEMFLARWIESVWAKEQILEAYLVTARFERGVYGFHRAYRHFFEDSPTVVEDWEALLLIERLGNIHGRFISKRIEKLLNRAIREKVISLETAKSALNFYSNMLGHHFALVEGNANPDAVLDALLKTYNHRNQSGGRDRKGME